ncbi:MAG: hypothetical protein PHG97_00850 [Candidatus Margulisbacteria bacterium]|nr:hypothetical protein [Candidatus Margulisiibacteriota bacterium]
MIALKLLGAVLFPALLGFGFVNLFLNKQEDAGLLERLALGFCAGLMLITLEMTYLLPVFHLRYSVLTVATPLTLILIWGLIVTFKNRLIDFKLNLNFKTVEKLLLAVLVLQVIFVFGTAMIKPVVGVDAWGNYSLRAKAYFVDGAVNLINIPSSGRGDHVALTQTWVFLCLNQWDDILGKINFPLYFAALLLLFYYAARRLKGRGISLLSAVMLGTLPFLVYHATLEYTDFALALYLFIGATLLLRWFDRPKINHLLLAFFFLFSILTIKNESYLHLVAVAIIFAANIFTRRLDKAAGIRAVRLGTLLGLVLGGLLFILKALSIRELQLLPFDVYAARLGPLVSVFFDYMFLRANWNIVWFILAVLLLFNFQRLKENLNLFLLVGLELLAFMLFYFTSADDVYGWLFYVTPAVRNLLQFMPLVVLALASLLELEWPPRPLLSAGRPKKKKKA